MILTGMVLQNALKRGNETVKNEVLEDITEGLTLWREGKPGGLSPYEFSLRQIFAQTVQDGYEALQMLDPRFQIDTTEAVDSSYFSKITGQIIYSTILQAYESEQFVFTGLIPSMPTAFLDGEKIPGITGIGDEAELVGEGQQYPEVGFSDEYIETPRTEKRGNIVSVTREAIFSDRTGLVLQRAAAVGEFLGLNKEKRLVDVAIGATNNYKRNGTSTDTYQTSTPWINDQSNPLNDWEDLDQSQLLLDNITDPNTGEPIMVRGDQIVVTQNDRATANRLLSATSVEHLTNSGNTRTVGANPAGGMRPAAVSKLMKARIESELGISAANAAQYWFHGDFEKAFAYMEVFPITTTQAPTNATLSFERDIVARYKASERGVAVVKDPRYVVRNTN